jgi:hypothetical protein
LEWWGEHVGLDPGGEADDLWVEPRGGVPVSPPLPVAVSGGSIRPDLVVGDQDSLVPASLLPCGSVAWPEKSIVSPAVQVRVVVAVSMIAAGGESPGVIVTDAGSLTSPAGELWPGLCCTRSAGSW